MDQNMKRIYINRVLAFLLPIFVFSACEDKKWSEDFDIDWPTPLVSNLSTREAMIEDVITITGSNLDKVYQVSVGLTVCDIVEGTKTANQLQFKLPRRVSSGQVTVRNLYKRAYTFPGFVAISYPDVRVTKWPTAITAGEAFNIDGENVDLITEVIIEGKTIVIRTGTSTDRISVSTAGLNLVPGTPVTISIKALGPIVGNSQVAGVPVEEPSDTFDPVAPIVLWDFESGMPTIRSAGGTPDVAALNHGGLVSPRGQNYFSVLVAQTGGWSNFIYIDREGPFDLSNFNDPHITFLVNTNGKRGYINPFMTQGGSTKDNHLTNGNANERMRYNDNYLVATQGWEWRSYPVKKLFPDFDEKGVFDQISMRFTSGNVGNGGAPEDFEIHVDQIMITDGLQLPMVKIFDFESGAPAWDNNAGANPNNVSGSISTAAPKGGFAQYYSLKFDSHGSWNWVGAISYNNSIDLSSMIDPYISFLVNTNGNRGFFQFETVQNDVKWGGSIPNVYEVTTNGWVSMTLRLSDVLTGNWGGTGTADKFDPKRPMDYFKIGFSTGNVASGTYEINIDEIYISDGGMW